MSDKLTNSDMAHLYQEWCESFLDSEEGGYVDAMSSIGYVGVWSDGDITYHGHTIANVLAD